MKFKIVPAIIAKDFRDLKAKIKMVEPFVDWVQLDIMDGKFVSNETWNEPKKLEKIIGEVSSELKFEAHLMVRNPYRAAKDWIISGCKRIFIHWEALSIDKKNDLEKIIKKAEKNGVEIGIAFNPETSWQIAKPFLTDGKINSVLFMSVFPGFAGQKFLPEVLQKIKSLRDVDKNIKIEIDGGIDAKTGRLAISAGANILAIGSAIFNAKEIEGAINDLKGVLKY